MTRIENAARSPRNRSLRARRAGSVLLGGVVIVLVGQYLAGYLLLWSIHLPPQHATPFTTLRYYHFYGQMPDMQRRLLRCSTVAFGLVALSAVAALWPKPRP